MDDVVVFDEKVLRVKYGNRFILADDKLDWYKNSNFKWNV